MKHRLLAALFVPVACLLCAPLPLAAQQPTAVPGTWSPPQTSWGHPDLQGTWSNASTTPLERPADLAGQEVLTDEEWAARNVVAGLSDDRPVGDPVGFYNNYWFEQGELSKRTSLIVDPAMGDCLRRQPRSSSDRARAGVLLARLAEPVLTPGRTSTHSTGALHAACRAR